MGIWGNLGGAKREGIGGIISIPDSQCSMLDNRWWMLMASFLSTFWWPGTAISCDVFGGQIRFGLVNCGFKGRRYKGNTP
jgi:hypothetical protein